MNTHDTVDQWLYRSAQRWVEDHPDEARALRDGHVAPNHNEWFWRAERIFAMALKAEAPVEDVNLQQGTLL